MAEDAVDEAIKTFDLTTSATSFPDISGANIPGVKTTGVCCTRNLPLLGAHGYSSALASQLRELHPIDADVAEHLAANYGDRAWAVLSVESPSSPSSTPATARLAPQLPFIEAEIRHGVRSESACTVADIISRRTRLAFLDIDQALRALPRVVDVMAEELGWSGERIDQEWKDAISFFKSMGLEQDKLNITREQVLALAPTQKTQAKASEKPTKQAKLETENAMA